MVLLRFDEALAFQRTWIYFHLVRSGSCEDTSCFCGLSIHIPIQTTAPHFSMGAPRPLHIQSWGSGSRPLVVQLFLEIIELPSIPPIHSSFCWSFVSQLTALET